MRQLPGVDVEETDTVKVGNQIIALGYTMTPQQHQEMVEKAERGEDTGMQTNGYSNFCIVETGDPKNPVSVVDASRGGPGWGAGVRRLGYGLRWYAGRRLLVRNLDASKLGL